MRNYKRIDSYLNILIGEIYEQPEDTGHTGMSQEVIDKWIPLMPDCKSVLDVGCGTGFCQPMFEKYGVSYEGICLGEDYSVAIANGKNVKLMDFSFLEYKDESFDLIFSRHSLEHSPMPVLTLMEWYRVSKQWCCVVLPAPEHYTYIGANHYSVMPRDLAREVFKHAGWKVVWEDLKTITYADERVIPYEYHFMLEKIR